MKFFRYVPKLGYFPKGAFTLIELLIVVAIIAILAAIAVPNFLEAQTRSKVSRAMADQRSVVTALESYRVDFNKYPEDSYLDDLNKLKSSLQGHPGLYRGIMFQVDRGKTFAKSFKEFVECAWQGTGYLENANLHKYYWQQNQQHIKHKDGVVFSDVYHAKDRGDPQYYLDLIFQASRKVGIDLDIYGGGLKDGKRNQD